MCRRRVRRRFPPPMCRASGHRERASHTCEQACSKCPLPCESGTTRAPRRYSRVCIRSVIAGAGIGIGQVTDHGWCGGGRIVQPGKKLAGFSPAVWECRRTPHARFEGSHRHGLGLLPARSLWQLHRSAVAPISFRRMRFARCRRVALKAAFGAPASASGSRRAQRPGRVVRVRTSRPCFEREEAAQIVRCPFPSTRNSVQGGLRQDTVNSHSYALWVIFFQAHENMHRSAAACVGKRHKRQTRLVRLP
ncbi:hypothetical protein L227DRAFT_98014 [Lentinus tigrinus ALCF2SS1-6]|uniref:Uncharacterized protein n=1 Tax=Lentinus tigrinus ALCF2SS1-6 TaxID=1328759 RepID=A0A5C2S8X5_9APHY|nr:hypothetical protein L227DRAFT_98014 [Lentinus tigrinus ALCF2SS1-6]